jgi:Acetyltransferase (GNAT) domain
MCASCSTLTSSAAILPVERPVGVPETRIVEKGDQRDMKYRWVARPVTLDFDLGNIILFSRSFSAKELAVHFSHLSSNPDEPPPPMEELSSGLEAAFVRSHPVTKSLPALKILPQVIRYVPAQYRRFSIDLQGSFDDYLKKFSGKSRQTLARKVRRFSRSSGGALCWREYRGSGEMEEFHPLACEVSRRSWQAKQKGAGFPESAEFRREMSDLAGRDAVRGYILFHQQRPAAFAYCEVEEGALVYAFVGYDLDFERWSPGTVLHYLIIQKQFRELAFQIFDLGGRDDWYKEFLSTRSTLCADILYFHRDTRTFLLILLHFGLRFLRRLAGKTLDLLGLKAFVRKLLRREIPVYAITRRGNGLTF